VKTVYLCILMNKYDGVQQVLAARRKKSTADKWKVEMLAEDADGFSAADKLECVPVVREMRVLP